MIDRLVVDADADDPENEIKRHGSLPAPAYVAPSARPAGVTFHLSAKSPNNQCVAMLILCIYIYIFLCHMPIAKPSF